MNGDDYRELRKRIDRIEQQTAKLPSRINAGAGGGGGATDPDTFWYEATTKAGLENTDVSRHSFGQVVGVGADNGMFCIRNPDNDGWDAINFLE